MKGNLLLIALYISFLVFAIALSKQAHAIKAEISLLEGYQGGGTGHTVRPLELYGEPTFSKRAIIQGSTVEVTANFMIPTPGLPERVSFTFTRQGTTTERCETDSVKKVCNAETCYASASCNVSTDPAGSLLGYRELKVQAHYRSGLRYIKDRIEAFRIHFNVDNCTGVGFVRPDLYCFDDENDDISSYDLYNDLPANAILYITPRTHNLDIELIFAKPIQLVGGQLGGDKATIKAVTPDNKHIKTFSPEILIQNFTFSDAIESYAGGSIHAENSERLELDNVTFSSNRITYLNGEAMYIFHSDDVSLFNTSFISNGDYSSFSRSALWVVNSKGLRIRDSQFTSNRTGGILLDNGSDADIRNTNFSNNVGDSVAVVESTAKVYASEPGHSTFKYNSNTSIFTYRSDLYVDKVWFLRNSDNSIVSEESYTQVTESRFKENESQTAIYAFSKSRPEDRISITNSYFLNNNSVAVRTSEVPTFIKHSVFKDNFTDCYESPYEPVAQSIDVSPNVYEAIIRYNNFRYTHRICWDNPIIKIFDDTPGAAHNLISNIFYNEGAGDILGVYCQLNYPRDLEIDRNNFNFNIIQEDNCRDADWGWNYGIDAEPLYENFVDSQNFDIFADSELIGAGRPEGENVGALAGNGNLLLNASFEDVYSEDSGYGYDTSFADYWEYSNSGDTSIPTQVRVCTTETGCRDIWAPDGERILYLNTENRTTGENRPVWALQRIAVEPGEELVIEGSVIPYMDEGNDCGAVILIEDNDHRALNLESAREQMAVQKKGQWQRQSYSYSVPEDGSVTELAIIAYIVRSEIDAGSDPEGLAFFDDLRVYRAE